MNHFKEASFYFREALNLNPSYLPAYKNVENLSNFSVERWHFRMLNDTKRNECFRRAIHAKIEEGYTKVLDVGTGTGLLSLFAVEKDPKFVYACDYSEVMASIAGDIMESNGLSDKVKIINKLSSSLQIPDDLPEKVDLLVTETVDAGLIGEGLLETLDDAWERLVIRDINGAVKKLKIIPERASLYLVPLESSYLRRKFKYTCDNSPFNCIPSGCVLTAELEEPYDTIDLKSIDYKFLSEPVEVTHIDFNSPREIKELLNGDRNIELTVECNRNGLLDAFCVWFDLHLDDSETISTTPLSDEDCCWDQAVFPVTDDIAVWSGTTIQLKMDASGGTLSLVNYTIENSQHERNRSSFKVTKDLLSFLNSETTMDKLNRFYSEIVGKNTPVSNVLDTMIYPFVGFKLSEKEGCKLITLKNSEIDLRFLKACHRSRNTSSNSSDFHSLDSLSEYLKEEPVLDVVIIDLLDCHGELNDSLMALYPLIKKTLHEDSIIFPEDIMIHCQLAYSDWLENSSKLNNNSLLEGYEGFSSLNNFKVKHFIDLDINKLKYTKKSCVLDIAEIKIERIFREELEEFIVTAQVTEDGPFNSILYWFSYGNDRIRISSNAEDFYRNQMAEILERPLIAKCGDNIQLKLQIMSCILKFNVIQ